MKNYMVKSTLVVLVMLLSACTLTQEDHSNDIVYVSGPNITDIDGNVYPTVTTGNQTWTRLNLMVSNYTDGTPIPQVVDPLAWANLTTGAWCYNYTHTTPGGNAVFGKLYNWYAVAGIYDEASLNNPALRKKLAPEGYHIPSLNEWTTLLNYLGGKTIAGGKMKEVGVDLWLSPNESASNSSGFSALPVGKRADNGWFDSTYSSAYFWSSTTETVLANGLYLYYDYEDVNYLQASKKSGYSVRCVKD